MTSQELCATYFEQYVKNLAGYIKQGETANFGADHRNEYDFATLAVADGVAAGMSDEQIASRLRGAGLSERQITLVVECGLETRENKFYGY